MENISLIKIFLFTGGGGGQGDNVTIDYIYDLNTYECLFIINGIFAVFNGIFAMLKTRLKFCQYNSIDKKIFFKYTL